MFSVSYKLRVKRHIFYYDRESNRSVNQSLMLQQVTTGQKTRKCMLCMIAVLTTSNIVVSNYISVDNIITLDSSFVLFMKRPQEQQPNKHQKRNKIQMCKFCVTASFSILLKKIRFGAAYHVFVVDNNIRQWLIRRSHNML